MRKIQCVTLMLLLLWAVSGCVPTKTPAPPVKPVPYEECAPLSVIQTTGKEYSVKAGDYFEVGRGYWIHATEECVWEVGV